MDALSSPPEATAEPHAADWIGRHQAAVWRYLLFLGCQPDRAEDLTQDAFLAALRTGIADWGDAASAAWLRTTARNLYRMELRRIGRRPGQQPLTIVDDAELERAFLRHAGDDGGTEYLDALEECMKVLGEREHRILDLRYGCDVSRQQLAAALGIGTEGAKTLLRRVKARLRACIESRRSTR